MTARPANRAWGSTTSTRAPRSARLLDRGLRPPMGNEWMDASCPSCVQQAIVSQGDAIIATKRSLEAGLDSMSALSEHSRERQEFTQAWVNLDLERAVQD